MTAVVQRVKTLPCLDEILNRVPLLFCDPSFGGLTCGRGPIVIKARLQEAFIIAIRIGAQVASWPEIIPSRKQTKS